MRILPTIVLSCLLGAGADAQPSDATAPSDRDWNATLGIDLGSFGSKHSLAVLSLAGVVAFWTVQEEDETHAGTQNALDDSAFDAACDVGNVWGSGWVIGGASLSMLSAGMLARDDAVTAFGADLCRSYLYSGLATGALKYAVGRRRPSGGPLSFPSGHTTAAFSAVPVVWHHLGPLAGTGAGLLAVSTGLGRVEENRHYVSDVVFGAALGWVVGSAVIEQRVESGWREHVAVTPTRVGLQWEF